MSKKKYRGKICVYCADAPATAGDHVFAREFFLKEDRNNLPQVPACDVCNGAKAQLEHYLTALLPFGGRHSAAGDNLELVPRRLAKNVKLHRTLAANWGRARSKEDGVYLSSPTLPVDEVQLNKLLSLIVRGLVWFHWETLLTRDHFMDVMALTEAGEHAFDKLMGSPDLNSGIQCDLGNGTVCYEGKQGINQPEITVWRILMYGGLKFADPENRGESSSVIAAMTGPARLRDQMNG